ncbi:MAG: ribonuclease P protein component [Bacteroidetes bacterium]|nr:ribonuclease P protein component [Bacteroidota bacterium]
MKNFSLSSKERIKKRKDFEIIYSAGSIVYSSGKTIKAIYNYKITNIDANIKIAAVVGKRQGCAVWRNRVKRLIKESYRLNKEMLLLECLEKKLEMKIVFSSPLYTEKKNKNLELIDFMPGIIETMLIIRKKL